MDELMQRLLAFPSHSAPLTHLLTDQQYEEGIRTHIGALNKLSEKNLTTRTPGGESLLDVLDPGSHSVSYIYVLLAYANSVHKGSKIMEWKELWMKMATFLCIFDGRQIRFVPKLLDQVIQAVTDVARSMHRLSDAVAPIGQSIIQLDPSASVLTDRHLHLVHIALESGDFGSAVPVLEKGVLYFPSAANQVKYKSLAEVGLHPSVYLTQITGLNTKLTYQDVLEYFYYGAMVYQGLGRWEDALDFLESAITYPSKDQAVSNIVVEAYKKWVLVSLLVHGKAPSLPKTVGGASAKAFHALGKPYDTMASIFETGSAPRLKAEAEHGKKMWSDDRNSGLVNQVLAAYQRNQIRNLANVYSKISISEIQALTSGADTSIKPTQQVIEHMVQNMIATGQLEGSLSYPPGNNSPVLTFSEYGPVLSEENMQRELLTATARVQFLTSQLKQTDKVMIHDKDYIKHIQKQKKAGAKAGDDVALAGESGIWNDTVEDETLMDDGF